MIMKEGVRLVCYLGKCILNYERKKKLNKIVDTNESR